VVLPKDVGGSRVTPVSTESLEITTWSYAEREKTDFFSAVFSSAQRLPNGNTLICSGFNGTLLEVTTDKKIVWKYANPDNGGRGTMGFRSGDRSRFDPVNPGWGPAGTGAGGPVFRAFRYAANYPGLAGKDLTPGETVENLQPNGWDGQ
jgi:hypothetical protein